MQPLKPTVGRIVHYVSRGSADGVYPSVDRAAIVTDVQSVRDRENPTVDKSLVKLAVFNPEGLYFPPMWVEEGTQGGNWHWPDRD